MSSDVSVRELITRANRLLASGDLANARSLAQQAYKLNKNDPDVLVLVSKVVTDVTRQRAALQSAVQLDPNHTEARQRLAALDTPPPTCRTTPEAACVPGAADTCWRVRRCRTARGRGHSPQPFALQWISCRAHCGCGASINSRCSADPDSEHTYK